MEFRKPPKMFTKTSVDEPKQKSDTKRTVIDLYYKRVFEKNKNRNKR